jgi:hypothetical protein
MLLLLLLMIVIFREFMKKKVKMEKAVPKKNERNVSYFQLVSTLMKFEHKLM